MRRTTLLVGLCLVASLASGPARASLTVKVTGSAFFPLSSSSQETWVWDRAELAAVNVTIQTLSPGYPPVAEGSATLRLIAIDTTATTIALRIYGGTIVDGSNGKKNITLSGLGPDNKQYDIAIGTLAPATQQQPTVKATMRLAWRGPPTDPNAPTTSVADDGTGTVTFGYATTG